MSLEVPLTLRVGNKHITRAVSGVTFRKEAIGGVKSISLNVGHTLDQFDADLAPYSRVYVYDARTGATVAEGRLSDTGRSASAGDGQVWQMAAFGPAAHADDITGPLVYVDQSLSDGWRQADTNAPLDAAPTVTPIPGNRLTPVESIMMQYANGKVVPNAARIVNRYIRLLESGQKLARVAFNVASGVTDANYQAQAVTRTNEDVGENAYSANLTVTTAGNGAAVSVVVVTNFPNGRNSVEFRLYHSAASATVGDDNHWVALNGVIIRSLLLNADGTEQTAGYVNNYVLAHEVVRDLLGRVLPQFDGAAATVDTGAAYQIDSLVYPDGVTPSQVLADLMALEPAYRWTTGPSTSAGKYAFRWEPWPTTVRYEVTLDDGGDFPVSSQDLYNRVHVRWVDSGGATQSTIRTGACKILDDAGVIRQASIDLGSEVSSSANAARVGDNFLADHNVPANAGTLVINRPIRDLSTGRMVLPHEIEPGELIRVRGVAAYPDALNASSNDGQTVFRIWSMTYNSDSDSSSLELDTYARTTANALAALKQSRERKG